MYQISEKPNFKKKDDGHWKDPESVISSNGEKALIKEANSHIRAHSCYLQPKEVIF